MNLHYVKMKRKTKPLWERLVPIPLFWNHTKTLVCLYISTCNIVKSLKWKWKPFMCFKCFLEISRASRGLEFVWNLLDSIPKFAIRLIRQGKKYSKNSMKITSKFVRFDTKICDSLNSTGKKNIRKIRWKLIRNSFDSIQVQL